MNKEQAESTTTKMKTEYDLYHNAFHIWLIISNRGHLSEKEALEIIRNECRRFGQHLERRLKFRRNTGVVNAAD